MKIKAVKRIRDDAAFEDIRFSKSVVKAYDAFERVKSYGPAVSYIVTDDKGEVIATTYANENVWAGQDTLFISSVKIRGGEGNPAKEEILDFILKYYDKDTPEEKYDAVMSENSNASLDRVFASNGYGAIRELVNFGVTKSNLLKNLNCRANDAVFASYSFSTLDLGEIYKYSPFQDDRPGWNTSNLTIVKNEFNTLLALMDKGGTVYAVCAYDERFGLISRIAVHPLSRKKGFGSYIFREAARRIKSDYVIMSDILSGSGGPTLFLTNIGFEPIQTKREFHKEF